MIGDLSGVLSLISSGLAPLKPVAWAERQYAATFTIPEQKNFLFVSCSEFVTKK
jgi:hypothetical protein